MQRCEYQSLVSTTLLVLYLYVQIDCTRDSQRRSGHRPGYILAHARVGGKLTNQRLTNPQIAFNWHQNPLTREDTRDISPAKLTEREM